MIRSLRMPACLALSLAKLSSMQNESQGLLSQHMGAYSVFVALQFSSILKLVSDMRVDLSVSSVSNPGPSPLLPSNSPYYRPKEVNKGTEPSSR